MITQVRTPRQRQRFRSACRGKLCLGVTMPQALELFGKSQPGRFFVGPTLALDVGGSTAWLAGHANPDELASFLHFCGCKAVILDEAECPPPTGWARAKSHFVFGLAPGKQLPEPAVEETLWASLHLTRSPRRTPLHRCCFRTAPRGGMIFTLSSAQSAPAAGLWSGLWSREGSLPAPWALTPLERNRLTWPAARLRSHCGGAASAGGSSSGWPTPSQRRACSPSFSVLRNGCTFIPASALKSWESMPGTKPQSDTAGVSLRTVRWGGTLLPQAIGRAMEWPATTATAASGGCRKLLLGPRPARRKQCAADAGSRNPNSCPRRKLPTGHHSINLQKD